MSSRPVIGYYVNHHGSGHLARAAAIIDHLDADVTVLSSAEYAGPASVVHLPLDDGDEDADAGGVLHWAPLGSPGLRARMARIASWIEQERPDAVVVDVSVEVALLARLCGVRTIVMAMPGERSDPPHQLAYRAADRIVAAWPQGLYEPGWLTEHADRTIYVGGISRLAERPAPVLAAQAGGRSAPVAAARAGERRVVVAARAGERRVVVLGGQGGTTITDDAVAAAAAATPGWRWQALGVAGAPWVADPFPVLAEADVVVAAAGQSSVADLAVVGRPAVVLCEERPFGEQLATGAALERGGLATVLRRWPAPESWADLLEAATAGPWEQWQTAGAAERAAAAIRQVARTAPPARTAATTKTMTGAGTETTTIAGTDPVARIRRAAT